MNSNVNPKLILFIEVGISMLLAALLLATYPTAFYQIGSINIASLFVSLLIYALIGIVIERKIDRKIVHIATIFGFLIGLLFVIDLFFETFIDFCKTGNSFSVLFFMMLIFICWVIVGALGKKMTNKFRIGIIASVWSSLIGILIAIIAGFLINLLFSNRLEQTLLHSEEYMRSSLRDIKTFTLYNTLIDSAVTHLMEGPILALIFGTVGILVSKVIERLPTKTKIKKN